MRGERGKRQKSAEISILDLQLRSRATFLSAGPPDGNGASPPPTAGALATATLVRGARNRLEAARKTQRATKAKGGGEGGLLLELDQEAGGGWAPLPAPCLPLSLATCPKDEAVAQQLVSRFPFHDGGLPARDDNRAAATAATAPPPGFPTQRTMRQRREQCAGYCLIQYWKHGSWLSAINCPLCRQKVVFLYTCSENQPDKKSKQTFYDIRIYNKRFSGLPQSFIDHLYDMPLLLLVILRGIFTLTALVWIFLFRVVICFFGTIMCSTCPPEGMPEPLCGILQTADNLAVMLLLLISFINICPQMESEGANRTISRE
uniref:Ring finger protein 170 n=1 Tax=Pseudonaja textilis TaxID=8673 RepID=A0A670Y2X9_PSETE